MALLAQSQCLQSLALHCAPKCNWLKVVCACVRVCAPVLACNMGRSEGYYTSQCITFLHVSCTPFFPPPPTLPSLQPSSTARNGSEVRIRTKCLLCTCEWGWLFGIGGVIFFVKFRSTKLPVTACSICVCVVCVRVCVWILCMHIKEIKLYHIFLTFINGVYVALHLSKFHQLCICSLPPESSTFLSLSAIIELSDHMCL